MCLVHLKLNVLKFWKAHKDQIWNHLSTGVRKFPNLHNANHHIQSSAERHRLSVVLICFQPLATETSTNISILADTFINQTSSGNQGSSRSQPCLLGNSKAQKQFEHFIIDWMEIAPEFHPINSHSPRRGGSTITISLITRSSLPGDYPWWLGQHGR